MVPYKWRARLTGTELVRPQWTSIGELKSVSSTSDRFGVVALTVVDQEDERARPNPYFRRNVSCPNWSNSATASKTA